MKELEESLARTFEEKEEIEKRLADPKSLQGGTEIEKSIQEYNRIQNMERELMKEWEVIMERLEEAEKEI
jgi:protein subunit release factor A